VVSRGGEAGSVKRPDRPGRERLLHSTTPCSPARVTDRRWQVQPPCPPGLISAGCPHARRPWPLCAPGPRSSAGPSGCPSFINFDANRVTASLLAQRLQPASTALWTEAEGDAGGLFRSRPGAPVQSRADAGLLEDRLPTVRAGQIPATRPGWREGCPAGAPRLPG